MDSNDGPVEEGGQSFPGPRIPLGKQLLGEPPLGHPDHPGGPQCPLGLLPLMGLGQRAPSTARRLGRDDHLVLVEVETRLITVGEHDSPGLDRGLQFLSRRLVRRSAS